MELAVGNGAPDSQTEGQVLALQLSDIDAGYAGARVLRDVNIAVRPSSVLALLGANGAGKTTLLRVAAGLLKPNRGTVAVNGVDVTGRSADRRAHAGVCLIPEGRGIFPSLTVQENLELQVPPWSPNKDLRRAFDFFPELLPHVRRIAGTLSGGEQQMVALARATLSDPRVVLVDEVSMGLAPRVVDRIFAFLRDLASTGVAIVLVEQYVTRALAMADVVSIVNRGSIAYTGSPTNLDEETLRANYLGGA